MARTPLALPPVLIAIALVGCGSQRTNVLAHSPPTATSGPTAQSASATSSPSYTTPTTTRPISTVRGRRPVRRSLSLAGRTVVLDPGHNGANAANPQIINGLVPAGRGAVKPCNTTGTATASGYAEAAFNFSVALNLRRLLRSAGAKVVMTRSNNTGVGPCVNVRAAIGNRANADAVLAIHADGGPPNGRGFGVLYPPDAGDTTAIHAASMSLADDVHDAIVASGLLPPSTYLGQDGYQQRYDLAGLNLSTRPAIFVELGNMANATDAALQETSSFRTAIAGALYQGLARFLTTR